MIPHWSKTLIKPGQSNLSTQMSRIAISTTKTTLLKLNPNIPSPTSFQIQQSQVLFSHAPILRFTVGKVSQLPPADSPEVAFLGRSNVGVSPFPCLPSLEAVDGVNN